MKRSGFLRPAGALLFHHHLDPHRQAEHLFEERGPIIDGSQAWPGEGAEAAAASGGGVPVPGDAALDPLTLDPDRQPGIDQRGDWPAY